MRLNWGIGKDSRDVPGLIARGKVDRAVELLRAQLRENPTSVHLRQSLADTLVMAGNKDDAAAILVELADDFARDGFPAKAIAILKKIDRISPGRTDVYDRLAAEIPKKEEEQDHRRKSYFRTKQRELEGTTPEPIAPLSGDELEIHVVFEDYFAREDEIAREQRRSNDAGLVRVPKNLTTPLFESLPREELLAMVGGLQLLTYEPGDVIVAEGESGDSLFILTSGRVKAFVRDAVGHLSKVREMTDGDFFGEISFLKAKPRTATITAASRCELLVLDRPTLLALCESHPHVRKVLERFSSERENSPDEISARTSTGEP